MFAVSERAKNSTTKVMLINIHYFYAVSNIFLSAPSSRTDGTGRGWGALVPPCFVHTEKRTGTQKYINSVPLPIFETSSVPVIIVNLALSGATWTINDLSRNLTLAN